MGKYPYMSGDYVAVIFTVCRADGSREEIAVAYNERTHDFNFTDRIIIDGEPFYVGGMGAEWNKEIDVHFRTFTLIHQAWHDDNVRAEREYLARKNFAKALTSALRGERVPPSRHTPDIGAVYYLDDLMRTGL